MLAVLMVFGTVSSWALTADLSLNYELAGYKAKAFYDFTGNADGVLPTEGDLRYRDNGYGLFNFGSGGRSANVGISVSEGDLVVCQFADTQNRGVTINSISGCTKSTTINDGSHIFFEADSDLGELTFNVGRGGCVVSVLIMEVDNTVATADYTLNYIYDGNPVKTVNATGAVGGQVLTDASFFANDVKYFRADGQPESFVIAAGDNIFTVNVRLAEIYAYTLLNNLGETITTGSGFEGETVNVGYPRYLLADGAFYEAGKSNNEYRAKIALNEDNTSSTVTYTLKEGVNAVFYAEGEKTEGMTVSTAGNIPVRASGAEAGVAEEDVTITTLPVGKYIFHAGIFTSKSSYGENTVNFGIGEQTFSAAFTSVNLCEVASNEYTLNAETAIKFLTSSWADAQLDYLWIEKTGDVGVTTTYTVAGGNTDLFGTAWDPANTANDMTLNAETGLYEWSKADVTLEEGTVQFKVVVNHAWDEAYPAENYALNIAEAGTYDILITFNAETKVVNATATKKEEPAPTNTYTATFTTNAGWEKVYAYAWTTTDGQTTEFLGAWPGTELAAVNDVYTATINAEAAPAFIIFNNGNGGEGNQTADLAFENGKAYDYTITIPEPEPEYYPFTGTAYVIDTESGLFMAAGHNWGTQGIVNELGLDLIFTANEQNKKVTIDTRVSQGGESHFLGGNLYMDSEAYEWGLVYQNFGFWIRNAEGQYISLDDDNNLVLSDTPHEWIIVTAEGVMQTRLEEMAEATATNPVDATFLLQDPNFNRNDQRVAAWEISEDCTNKNLSGGNDENRCAESYHSPFTIMQTVEGVPAGIYELTAQGFYRQDEYEGEEAPAAPQFFANGVNADVPVKAGDENNMSNASESFTAGLYTIEPIRFTVAEDGMMYVGIYGTALNQWVIFDNFQLKYFGEEIVDAISSVNAKAENNAIYNLNGQQVMNAQKGLYIINGKKVVK